jgi:hypothetical protein
MSKGGPFHDEKRERLQRLQHILTQLPVLDDRRSSIPSYANIITLMGTGIAEALPRAAGVDNGEAIVSLRGMVGLASKLHSYINELPRDALDLVEADARMVWETAEARFSGLTDDMARILRASVNSARIPHPFIIQRDLEQLIASACRSIDSLSDSSTPSPECNPIVTQARQIRDVAASAYKYLTGNRAGYADLEGKMDSEFAGFLDSVYKTFGIRSSALSLTKPADDPAVIDEDQSAFDFRQRGHVGKARCQYSGLLRTRGQSGPEWAYGAGYLTRKRRPSMVIGSLGLCPKASESRVQCAGSR